MTALDTDLTTLLMYGHEPLRRRVSAQPVVHTTIVTRIEILQGRFAAILKAATGDELIKAQERLELSEAKFRPLPILPFDNASAAIFDRLRSDRKLRSIGRTDLLIACICLARKATLVTRNLRHFRAVPGLTVENWAD